MSKWTYFLNIEYTMRIIQLKKIGIGFVNIIIFSELQQLHITSSLQPHRISLGLQNGNGTEL